MNPQSTGLKVAGTLFALLGLVQLTRLIRGWEIIVNHRELPLWPSGVAVVVLAGLSIWLFRLSRFRAM